MGDGILRLQAALGGRRPAGRGVSYDVEQDCWEWEEAETLKAHYQQVQMGWT